MLQLDPMISVKNVAASAAWYCNIFGFTNAHGGSHFAVLNDAENHTVLCLHAWEHDQHPTMSNPNIEAGNGLLLYFKTSDWQVIRQKLEKINWHIEEEIHLNINSQKQEFSFRDPDNYFLTVTEYHSYEG